MDATIVFSGVLEVDNKTMHEVLQIPYQDRKMLPWEHCSKKFYGISKSRVLQNLQAKSVLRCFYIGKIYYFNAGIVEYEKIEDLILHGKWQIYTWSN